MTSLQVFTLIHTVLSMVAITAGILVVKGLISSAGRQLWTLLFLWSTTATSITGFFFPFKGTTPALILGLISLIPISLAFVARYRFRLKNNWRGIYIVSMIVTLYFDCFVLVIQAFQKVPSLNALAPTQTEFPLKLTQLITLILFMAGGYFSFKNYQPKKFEQDIPNSYISPRLETE